MSVRPLIVALILCSACGKSKPKEAPEPTPAPVGSGGSAGPGSAVVAPRAPAAALPLDLAGMDKAVKPGDDFFSYANGTWFKATEIPADRAMFGTFAIAAELTSKRVATLIQSAASSAPAGSEARKVGDYYASYMDEAAIESKGLAPLQPALDKIAALTDLAGVSRALGETLRADVDVLNNTHFATPNLFGVWVAQDLTDPSKYSVFLLQGGLEMPSRDYYIDAAPRMADLRAKYQAHIAAMLTLAKIPGAEAKAIDVIEFETKLAKAHATHVETETVKNGTNHWARADFDKQAPGLDWTALFEGAGLAKQTDFVVWQPKAFTGIAAAVHTSSPDQIKSYLTYHALEDAAPFLPKAFVDESFAFLGTAVTGTPAQRDRWKRGVDATSDALGEAVGKLYVDQYFPAAAKAKVEALVKNLIAAFDRRIDALTWMAAPTKAKAKAKLAALKVAVGYPDRWRDYGGLEVVKGDALGNARRASLFEYKRNLAKLGAPVDRDEWVMTPQLVNAVNLPVMNALNFPAAILQPPYFDPSRPEVMDYGAIGAIIGHEISHSFDDQGAQFGASGKLENWWTKEDLAHFKLQGTALAKQYSAYKPFPDLALNGEQTLSENIADVAGLAAAYDAYRSSLGGKEAPAWEGLTGDQQFYVSFGQAWRNKAREPELRRRVLTDGHAPPEFRADTVRNQDAWYAAFGVQAGEKLYLAPDARVRVW